MTLIKEIEAALNTQLAGSDAEMLYRDLLESAKTQLEEAEREIQALEDNLYWANRRT